MIPVHNRLAMTELPEGPYKKFQKVKIKQGTTGVIMDIRMPGGYPQYRIGNFWFEEWELEAL